MMTTAVSWLPDLFSGLCISLIVAVLSIVLGFAFGLLLSLGLIGRNHHGWHSIAVIIVEIGRGIPTLVLLYLLYYGLPNLKILLSSFMVTVLGLAFTTAAYSSEIFRGAIESVEKGQTEAAQALGMSSSDRFRLIILPQAMRNAIPPLMGYGISMFQTTSLAYNIALPELLAAAYAIGTRTFQYLTVLLLAGAMYLLITIPATVLSDFFERRLAARG